MSIFRAYDIRGLYPSEVNENGAEDIGKAFGTFLPKGSMIAVGGDVRTSTPSLKARLIEGLRSTGAHVIDIGMVPTPVLYFAVASMGLDGGIVVTASHNPKQYNGFKPVVKGGVCLSWETGIGKMKEIIDKGAFRTADQGSLETQNVEDAYITHILSKITVAGKRKIVVDAANGACSLLAPKVFGRLGWDVVPLFCEPDGTFPNHEADPIKKKNLAALQEKVKETGADIGISYDGDGDRLGVVNENGVIVENNIIFSLFIKDLLQKKPGVPVIYEVVVSKMVEDTIKKYGGIPLIYRVGHSYVQAGLLDKKASLAGENSGHYYFQENYGYDDSLFAGLKVAELLEKGPLSSREKEIPPYITSDEFRPTCDDDRKFQVVKTLQKKLKDSGHKMLDIDGARVIFDKGWTIIRASNTGSQLVVRWEAEDNESFDNIGEFVKRQLASVGVDLYG